MSRQSGVGIPRFGQRQATCFVVLCLLCSSLPIAVGWWAGQEAVSEFLKRDSEGWNLEESGTESESDGVQHQMLHSEHHQELTAAEQREVETRSDPSNESASGCPPGCQPVGSCVAEPVVLEPVELTEAELKAKCAPLVGSEPCVKLPESQEGIWAEIQEWRQTAQELLRQLEQERRQSSMYRAEVELLKMKNDALRQDIRQCHASVDL
mmetsp:Transcript_34698/g.54188  ORF Transcript_34698/g.54188 Transcript_34698/m.54188 type:complete len:209 (-) Transcript_34698:1502-2128(-)